MWCTDTHFHSFPSLLLLNCISFFLFLFFLSAICFQSALFFLISAAFLQFRLSAYLLCLSLSRKGIWGQKDSGSPWAWAGDSGAGAGGGSEKRHRRRDVRHCRSDKHCNFYMLDTTSSSSSFSSSTLSVNVWCVWLMRDGALLSFHWLTVPKLASDREGKLQLNCRWIDLNKS